MTAPDPWHSPTRPRVITLIDELPDNLGDYAASMRVRRYLSELRGGGISIDTRTNLPHVLLSSAEIKALMRAAYLDGRADEEADAKLRPPPEPTCEDVEFAGVAEDRHGDGLLAAQPATTTRPWPNPKAYRALACEVLGEAGPPKDVAPAVAAWKALADGQRVMCSRGYQWTARRADGRLRFTMAKADGRPGKTVEQPWYPCIMARLPVWPIVIEAAD